MIPKTTDASPTETPEKKRFAEYHQIYIDHQPEPPPMDLQMQDGVTPTANATKGANTKRNKFGPATMSPEAHQAALNQPPRNTPTKQN
jgi:hypothetical protein